MNGDLLNTSGTCSRCGGRVSNIDRKRHSRERLTVIHRDTCPGIHRVRKGT